MLFPNAFELAVYCFGTLSVEGNEILIGIVSLQNRINERTEEDLEIIYRKLKTFKLFRRVHPSVIQQLCFVAVVDHIDKGVLRKCIVFVPMESWDFLTLSILISKKCTNKAKKR